MSLDEITSELGVTYDAWKQGEKEKNKLKERFFAAATEELAQETPAQILEEVHADSAEKASELAAKKFPRFRVLDVLEDGEGRYRVALEELPQFRPFTHINKADGRVYSRQINEGAAILDDERIQEEDPELWKQITEPQRVIKPLEKLTSEQLVALRPYIYASKPVAKLSAPRQAKPEELELDEVQGRDQD